MPCQYRQEGGAISKATRDVIFVADPKATTTTIIACGDPSTMLPLVPRTSSTRCVGVECFRAADQRLEQAEDHQYLGYRSTKHGPVESRVAATQKQRHRCYRSKQCNVEMGRGAPVCRSDDGILTSAKARPLAPMPPMPHACMRMPPSERPHDHTFCFINAPTKLALPVQGLILEELSIRFAICIILKHRQNGAV